MDILYQPINNNNNWIIFVIIFMFGIVILLKNLFNIQFKQQFSIITNHIWLSNLKPSYSLIFNIYNLFYSLVLSLCMAFIILIAKQNVAISLSNIDFSVYIKTTSIVFLFLISKLFLNLIFSTFFELKNIIIKIVYLKISFLNSISLFILVWLTFVLFIQKSPFLIFNIGILISLVLALYFYYLLFKTNLKFLIKHFLYFILYLCALEIAPIIIFYRVFIF